MAEDIYVYSIFFLVAVIILYYFVLCLYLLCDWFIGNGYSDWKYIRQKRRLQNRKLTKVEWADKLLATQREEMQNNLKTKLENFTY
jgi:hypothetical protein